MAACRVCAGAGCRYCGAEPPPDTAALAELLAAAEAALPLLPLSPGLRAVHDRLDAALQALAVPAAGRSR